MQRWIVHDKAVAPSPIVVPHGIPQGDPAGPVIMNLLMYSLKKMVDSRMSKDPQDFFHVLYMDDRTYVGRTKAIVGEAQQVWAETAMRYKLKENMEKAQHVATNGNKILEQLGIEVQQCLLDSSVKHFLGGLDWVQRGDIFEHEFLRESFTLEHIADLQQWKRVAHVLRESFRLQSYDQFWIVQRHEIIGKRKPLYRGCRRELVLKWINCDSTAFLAAIGAIQSPLLKYQLRNIASTCPKCGGENPCWNHLWRCGVGIEPPDDPMLERFLWPRSKADLPLCHRFLALLKAIN